MVRYDNLTSEFISLYLEHISLEIITPIAEGKET